MELSDLGAGAGLEWTGKVTGVNRKVGGRWTEVVSIMSKWSFPHEQTASGIVMGGLVSLVLMNSYRLSGIREKMELSELGARAGLDWRG